MPANWSIKFSLQSEDVSEPSLLGGGTAVEAAVIESETVRFIDNAAGDTLELPTTDNPVARVDDTDDLTLGRFFARPTLIHTASWSTADIVGNLGSSFDPWSLFLGSTAIKKKLDNFAFLRGNLHIKILVNGTPFQYGALRYCYFPYASSGKIRTNSTSSIPLLVPYSQVPGVFVHPQANAGGQMTLPFFYLKNWLDITSASTVATMGSLQPVVYAPLRLAVTGGTTSVTLRTYAWMTDVQLMGSTLKLALQGDEYGQGPISLPASAIAAAARALTKVPVIGRFARATEIGAGAVSKMAALFGYTNVPVIDDVQPYVPLNAPHLASTQIGQPIQKLTVDPKQELSIDSSMHSLGAEDELALSYLKKKESYFGSTSWSTTDAANTQLFNCRVNPNLDSNVAILNNTSAVVGTRSYQVPLSYFGRLFTYWRGDIKIRVKVVCTKFHKGRLKISYDPVSDISTANPDENVVYTQILDIGEHDDVIFDIPYHQPEGWKTVDTSISDTAPNWTPGNALAPRSVYDNGTLTVRVLNTLTAPAASTVNLLFFVSGGDNFEFATPAVQLDPKQPAYPTMFNLQGEDLTDITPTTMVIGTKAKVMPERYAVNMGECIASLRSLLHRQTLYQVRTATDTPSSGNLRLRTVFKRFPAPPGYNPNGGTTATNVTVASGSSPFVFTEMTPVAWVTHAFCGYRGSFNWTLAFNSATSEGVDAIQVYRSNTVTQTQYLLQDNMPTGTYQAKISGYNGYSVAPGQINGDAMIGGGAITSTRTNNSVMVNVPNYNKNNFARAVPSEVYLGTSTDDTNTDSVVWQAIFNNSTTTNNVSLSMYVGAGPDYTPVFFLCCPTIDYLQSTISGT